MEEFHEDGCEDIYTVLISHPNKGITCHSFDVYSSFILLGRLFADWSEPLIFRSPEVVVWAITRAINVRQLVCAPVPVHVAGCAFDPDGLAHPTTYKGTGAHTSCLTFMTQWSPKRQLLAIGNLVAHFSLLISVGGKCLNSRHRNCHR